jgi:hypothetical protein
MAAVAKRHHDLDARREIAGEQLSHGLASPTLQSVVGLGMIAGAGVLADNRNRKKT